MGPVSKKIGVVATIGVTDGLMGVERVFDCVVWCFPLFGEAKTTVAVSARKSESMEGRMMKVGALQQDGEREGREKKGRY